jgi:hypothetical protein
MTRPFRVFLCCQQDLRPHPIPAYRFWAAYFRDAFAEAGHECLEAPGCDWAEGLVGAPPESTAAWREATWQRTVDWIKRENARRPIDLFLSYLYPEQVSSAGLGEIRSLGIPSVNFFCDNIRLFRQMPPEFASFDLNWVPEQAALEMYHKACRPYLNAPMPCWVSPRWRTPPAVESLPATFVGTRDELRERLFSRAYELGLEMDIRGRGWDGDADPGENPPSGRGWGLLFNQWDYAKRHGISALARKYARKVMPPQKVAFNFAAKARGLCFGDEYWQVLRESRVSIGVNRVANPRRSLESPDCYSRLRDLEAPMVGAAYLTEFAPGLENLYDIGREIEAYHGPEELASKTAELEKDEPRRRRLRELGQRRALGEHTISKTMGKIAERLGIT